MCHAPWHSGPEVTPYLTSLSSLGPQYLVLGGHHLDCESLGMWSRETFSFILPISPAKHTKSSYSHSASLLPSLPLGPSSSPQPE